MNIHHLEINIFYLTGIMTHIIKIKFQYFI